MEKRQWLTRGVGRCVVRDSGVAALETRCADDQPDWTPPRTERDHRILLARSGAYLRRVNGVVQFVDATDVLVTRPGDEIAMAHPMGGDTGTVVELHPDVVAGMAADGFRLVPGRRHLDDELDLRHRELLAASRRGMDRFEAVERVLHLVGHLGRPDVRSGGPRRVETVAAHQQLVDRAREALVEGRLGVGLVDLAQVVGCSPHHLSRVFHRVTGETLTAYRNCLRVRAVLTDLQDGADNLRALAATYGFADQAHLTRVVRRQLGHSPTELRALVTGGSGPAGDWYDSASEVANRWWDRA
jgi:AraC-like DNA-binding protein